MRSPAPSKRVFHEPLEAEDNQPDTQRDDGCGAKRESDHHAHHVSLPAHVTAEAYHIAAGRGPKFQTDTPARNFGFSFTPGSSPFVTSTPAFSSVCRITAVNVHAKCATLKVGA
jgi:hypothetical protein